MSNVEGEEGSRLKDVQTSEASLCGIPDSWAVPFDWKNFILGEAAKAFQRLATEDGISPRLSHEGLSHEGIENVVGESFEMDSASLPEASSKKPF